MSKATKKQLEENITIDTLSNNKDVYYSLAKKHGNITGSTFGGNNVFLIFNMTDGELYYALEESKPPFVHESDIKKKPKKDVVNVRNADIRNPPKTVQLIIKYSKSDEKGNQTAQEWRFDLVNAGMAQKWCDLLTDYKKSFQKKNTTLGPANSTLDKKKEDDPLTFLMTDSKILINKPQDPPKNPTNPPANTITNPSTIPKNQPQPMQPEQSRLRDAYELTGLTLNQSRIKPQNQMAVQNDWNFRFVKDPTRQTVYQFQQAAYTAFISAFKEMKDAGRSQYKNDTRGFIIEIVDCITPESKRLKNQYRNYHYIIQCCKGEAILSVPLTCLIEYLGSVALVKAKLPKQAIRIKNKKQTEQVISELQHRTKISNIVLFNNRSNFYDLTSIYGSYGEASRIYVDDLDQYMPEFNLKQKDEELNTFYVRPNLMQYFQGRIVPGGNIQALKNSKLQGQFSNALQSQITDIADVLSNQEVYIINIFDLKQFLHYRGVNMKFLYKIYQETKNKFVKKYLQTCIVAKIIKDEISIEVNEILKEAKNTNIEQFVQEQIRFFVEGKTATTNEYWKKISLKYRSLHGQSLNAHELVGGFLLSCLITLISAEYDLTKINKEKAIFKDQGIIMKGFVKRLSPKIKSYYRFSSKIVETVEICKYTEQNQELFKKLVTYMNLNSKNIPKSYNVNKSLPYILGYLSDFVPPDQLEQQTLPCSRQIYNLVNFEPPSAPTLKITLNYFNSYLKYLKQSKNKISEQCQTKLQNSIEIINYWLELQHPKICEFYEKASGYQDICGNTQKSLRILEEAINIAYKTEGKNTKKIGMRHYVAGCQYLKSGKKKQAIENLQKAKACLEKSEGLQSQHALTLLKLSSLQLNNGDTDSCIKYGKQALKNAQKGKMKDEYTIKIYQILCRAYEIKGQKEELKKLSLTCSKQFNRTQVKLAFSQMVKICLTGTLAKLNIDRSKSLVTLVHQLKEKNSIKDDGQSLYGLMEKARGTVVMENFMVKSDNVQKYLSQFLSKKEMSADANQFISTLCLVAGVVGVDFVEGLHEQKQFQ